MKRILILFVPKENWVGRNSINEYDQVLDMSDISPFIKEDPLAWENYFRNFTSTQILGEPILDLFQLRDNLNVWFYNKFRIFYDNRAAFYEIKYLKSIIDDNSEIHVVSENLDQSIFKGENIRISKAHRTEDKSRKNIFTVLKYALVFIYRVLISNKSNFSKRETLLLFQFSSERKIASKTNPESIELLNGYWSYLEEEYGNEFGYIEDMPFPSLIKKFKPTSRMFKVNYPRTFTNEYILFKSFLSKDTNNSIRQDGQNLSKNLKFLQSKLIEPEDLLITNHFIRLKSISNLYIWKFHSFDLFFKRTKNIKSILAYGENLSQSKITLDSAKKNGIKTYGLQHGIIRPYNVGYSLSPLEASIKPMPDVTLVWGDYWKKQLIANAHYKPEAIKIVGQPRTDIVPTIKMKYNEDSKLVSFFSQLQPDLNEKYAAAQSFIKVAKNHPELRFEIKLHPMEHDDIYSSLIKQVGAPNVKINTEKDTFQLIVESGIIMTCFSTVGGEALCFDKPLITFDSKGRDIAGYINDNVAHWAKNEKELNQIITAYKDNSLKKIDTNSYVERTFFKMDGNACLRIKDAILQ